MIHTFHDIWGYSIFYKRSNPNANKLIKNTEKLSEEQCKCKQRRYYKQEWNYDEIEQFCNDVQSQINDKTDPFYDALIFIISSHGETDDVILDSNCEEVSLFSIYDYFSTKNCSRLGDKPKLFWVDACRGSLRAKPATFVPKSVKNDQAHMTQIIAKDTQFKTINQDNNEIDEKKKGDSATASIAHASNTHAQANFYKVYANPSGYAAIDGTKGGILINAIKKTFMDTQEILKSTLDDIFRQIIVQSYNQSKFLSIQQPQVENTLKFKVKFSKPYQG